MKTLRILFAAISLLVTSLVWAQVNINTADVESLTSLNGIGQTKAEAIIQHREIHGPFKSIEELLEVKGIGDKTLENLKTEIVVE